MSRRWRQATPELAAAARTPCTRAWQLAGGAGAHCSPRGAFQKPNLRNRVLRVVGDAPGITAASDDEGCILK